MNRAKIGRIIVSDVSKDNFLKVHEWLAVSLTIGAVVLVCAISFFNDVGGGGSERVAEQGLEIHVVGAVRKPGSYHMAKGAKMAELLALAEPLAEADLRRMNSAAPLRTGQVVHVAGRPQITVYLDGAVKEPGALSVSRGTRLSDLSERDLFHRDADPKALQRKRPLQDQEVVYIPFQGL